MALYVGSGLICKNSLFKLIGKIMERKLWNIQMNFHIIVTHVLHYTFFFLKFWGSFYIQVKNVFKLIIKTLFIFYFYTYCLCCFKMYKFISGHIQGNWLKEIVYAVFT